MDKTWIRPYAPGNGRWLVIAWEAAALALLAWATIRQFELSGHGITFLSCTLAALWVIGAYRILQMGAYVGANGVRIYGLIRSRTMHWRDVSHVRLHKASHRLGPWEIESGMTVVIDRHDGSSINTELWAQGVDFHSRPGVFREVYHELRLQHQRAQSG